MPSDIEPLSLVADIGGTNTRVALVRGVQLLPETVERFRNADYGGLESVLAAYLDEQAISDVAGACVALAGPVRDGAGSLTNLDWTIDGTVVARATGADVVDVINDLQAQGHALGHLAPDALRPLVTGPDAPHAAKLVIGVGTGFNCAPVQETDRGRYVAPSEAGHASLPVRTAEDVALARDFATIHGFPAVEDVLSGRGLGHVARWHAERAGAPHDYTAADVMKAVEAGEPLAREALAMFIRFLGAVTGDLSLVHLPFGGVYLVGGVARAVAPYLSEMGFADALRDKGRFAGFMKNFPVFLVEDDYAALIGCAHHLAGKVKT